MDHSTFNYIVLPLLIFAARVVDVSLGTMRIVFVSRDFRALAAILGFFEVLIWLVVITQIMRNISSPIHYVAYASGYAMGNYAGISIERKLSMGVRAVRIVTSRDASDLVAALRDEGFGVTSINGEGLNGPVKLIFTIVRRNLVPEVIKLIERFNPKAFYTIEDVKFVQEDHGKGKDSVL
ncbi:MAG: DUF2179 domain-containing protein [Candidatus Omnitrophica bacterium]|nr:DUF2179 domain-containing protein [Candidatus Omnitrophota bacterium]